MLSWLREGNCELRERMGQFDAHMAMGSRARRYSSWLAVGLGAVACCVIGASMARGRLAGNGNTGGPYVLEVKVEYRNGIRMYAVSHYKFFRVNVDGSRTELWTESVPGKYDQHWIGATGNLWVLTAAIRGPGGGGELWVRDREGNLLGEFGMSELYLARSIPERRDLRPRLRDPDANRALEQFRVSGHLSTYKNGAMEELRMLATGGFQEQVDALWAPKPGKSIAIISHRDSHSPEPIVAQVMRDRRYGVPSARECYPGSGLAIWTAKSLSRGVRDRNWLSGFPRQWQTDNTVHMSVPDHEVDGRPDALVVTPAKNFLWIEAPTQSNKRTRISYFSSIGKLFGRVDVARHYPASNLHLGDLCVQRNDNWVSYHKFVDPSMSNGVFEQLDIYDDNGDRALFHWDFKNGGKVSLFHGLAARRPKEDPADALAHFSERFQTSPNGQFALRIREVAAYAGHHAYRRTLLAKVQERGETRWVEMWSGFDYPPDNIANYVTNSGRVIMFSLKTLPGMTIDPRTGIGKEGMTDLATMIVMDTDGRELAGLDLFAECKLHSLADIRSQVLMRDLNIESDGRSYRVVEGLRVPVAQSESYTLRWGNGRSRIYHVAKNEFIGVDTLMWTN